VPTLVSVTNPYGSILGFLDRSCYFSFQVAPQLYSRGWVDSVPDPLLLWKSGIVGNRTLDLWICSQELWPLQSLSYSRICQHFMKYECSLPCSQEPSTGRCPEPDESSVHFLPIKILYYFLPSLMPETKFQDITKPKAKLYIFYIISFTWPDRLCGLVVRVPGYRSGGSGFDSRALQEVVGLERGPLSLVRTTVELFGRNSGGSGLESREYGHRDSSRWPRGTLYPQKSWH
jgi:hypothetical protein